VKDLPGDWEATGTRTGTETGTAGREGAESKGDEAITGGRRSLCS